MAVVQRYGGAEYLRIAEILRYDVDRWVALLAIDLRVDTEGRWGFTFGNT